MNNGTVILHITDCQVLGYLFIVKFGKELQFDNKFSNHSTATATTLHLYIENSQIINSFMYVEAKKYYSFMAIIVNSCIWSDTYIKKALE